MRMTAFLFFSAQKILLRLWATNKGWILVKKKRGSVKNALPDFQPHCRSRLRLLVSKTGFWKLDIGRKSGSW